MIWFEHSSLYRYDTKKKKLYHQKIRLDPDKIGPSDFFFFIVISNETFLLMLLGEVFQQTVMISLKAEWRRTTRSLTTLPTCVEK